MAEAPVPAMPPNEKDCPYICPGFKKGSQAKAYKEAGGERNTKTTGTMEYVPGMIQPPEPPLRRPGAPAPWLPQPSDGTTGDYLTMGPVDPWAPGHMDWSPRAGSTGLRPVVDKYSLTRYSSNEWRGRNKQVLDARPNQRGLQLNTQCHQLIVDTYSALKQKENNTHNMLDKRIKDITFWKKKVEEAQRAIDEELEMLEQNRMRLKKSSSILMIPEAISRECLELRTHRLEPDQVRDDTEQELIREIALVAEIRRVFRETLIKVDSQILENRASKASIEQDWSNKLETLRLDKLNQLMTSDSSYVMKHPGVDRWVDNSCALEYWLHYCHEAVRNCNDVVQKSKNLRGDLMTAIVKGGQDLKTQFDRTNMALGETIRAQEGLCNALEETLKQNLDRIVDTEKLIDYLKDRKRDLAKKIKLSMTRLHARNYDRPNVENCRDEAQYAIMDEIKFTREKETLLDDKLRDTENLRSELMKFRGDLELLIAGKRKCLNIDRDRMSMIRAHIPSPKEFRAE